MVFPLADILSITVREMRFSGIPTYISLIPTGTIISCLEGYVIRAPFSSILCMYFVYLMPVASSAGLYSSSNHFRSWLSICVSTRWVVIGFVLIVWSSVVLLSQVWNHLYKGIDRLSCARSHIVQLYIICFVALFPPFVAWSKEYCIIAACWSGRRILFWPPFCIGVIRWSFSLSCPHALRKESSFSIWYMRAAAVEGSLGCSRSHWRARRLLSLSGTVWRSPSFGGLLSRAMNKVKIYYFLICIEAEFWMGWWK